MTKSTYNIFKITDNVNAYADILNTATYLIFILANNVVIYPKKLNNTTFEIIVNKYIIKA